MKKKILLTLLFTLVLIAVTQLGKAQTLINEQYASSVIDFSSQYGGGPGYHAIQTLGMPEVYPNCGDHPNAWASSTADSQREFLVLGFTTPQPVNTIRIYQNVAPGAIDTVYLRNASNGLWTQVYSTTATASAGCIDLLEIRIPTTAFNADAIRIAINSPAVGYYNEIDAVCIANYDIMAHEWLQSGGAVIAFSSEYGASPGVYSAAQILGPPTTFPNCGDNVNAWLSLSADGQREYIEIGYTYPSKANRVRIYQNVAPGAIDTVYLREAGTGTWHMIYSATASAQPCPQRNILELNFTQTTYNVDAVRIAVNSPAVGYWNEIDAVLLQSDLPPGAKLSAQTGDWNNTATWIGAVVPGSADTVIIGNGHTISVNANVSAKSLFINPGGTLTFNTPHSLTLGSAGGGKEYLQVQGSVNMSGGTLTVNGNIEFQSGSSFTMSGGLINVDGNDGTAGGSVANGVDLFALKTGMSSCNVTGGTINIIDPQYNAFGQCISGSYSFGAATTLRLGNGSSTTTSNNINGFGGTNTYPVLGHLIIDAVTTTGNRHFNNTIPISITGNCTITSGKFEPSGIVIISGNLVNHATIQKTGGVFRVGLDLTNNGSITVTGGPFSVINDFINNAIAVYTVTDGSHTSVGDDLLNEGAFTSRWLYMANDFGTSSNEQMINGTGLFNVYGIQPTNNHANGISLLIPMTLQQLYFPLDGGRLFIGNNDLTLTNDAYGFPGSSGYVVMNGTGKLIIQDITTTPKIFPIGTSISYNPVAIVNGSGHTFSATVKTGFTYPPYNSAVVNREWDISDITGGAVSADITFQWNAGDEVIPFNRALSQVGHHDGSAWHIISPAAPASGTDPYTRTATGVSVFSPFAIGSGGALPVTLLNFAGSKCNNAICLLWTTEAEQDLSHFELEKSTTGINFSRVITVTALNQPGRHTYTNTDIFPINGFNYYRLKIIHTDGSFNYSSIIRIDMSKPALVSFQPNPATDRIVIKGMNGNTRIRIIDMSGKQMLSQNTQRSIEEVYIGALSTGIYMIQLVNEQGTTILKLLKQ